MVSIAVFLLYNNVKGGSMAKKYYSESKFIESGGQSMEIIILRPGPNKKPKEETPLILWIHGGGYVVGMARMIYMSRAKKLCEKYGAVVITPEYRLAKKSPYPAALDDCYNTLLYIKDNHDSLGGNPSKIMVGGESAGGGLTAAVCMYARDKGEVNISFRMPLYPMIDNTDTPSSVNNPGITWNTRRNHAAWKMYLRDIRGKIPPYAAPARQTDYRNLPPCYTFVGRKEPFYCETLTFIENLKAARVRAEVDVYNTGVHAFDMLLPFRKVSRKAIEEFERQYLYAAENYTAHQKD